MKVLLLGSGGREYTFCHQLAKSPHQPQLFIAPGNAGTAQFGTNIDVSPTDFEGLKQAALTHQIELVIVGPEVPLVEGVVDFFARDQDLSHIPVIGPSKQGAELEGSKEFAKAFMQRHNIPTAAYQSFTKDTLVEGLAYLETVTPPYVLKADGLAAGKGVVILNDLADAKAELTVMLADAKFGEASQKVVIEEFLDGIELSCFVLTDGKSYKILPMAKDYKRIGEGDTGPNTGGMGAYAPAPLLDEAGLQQVRELVLEPTLKALQARGIRYRGVIYAGLMLTTSGPSVIEFNCRFGDPECETLMPLLGPELAEVLLACATGTLNQAPALSITPQCSACVIAAAQGYPGTIRKGDHISSTLQSQDDLQLFHAGTQRQSDGSCVSSGGRVLAVVAQADTFDSAFERAYSGLAQVRFEGMTYRRDIGHQVRQR